MEFYDFPHIGNEIIPIDFHNHWDPVLDSIVDYLLEAVASMRLGFHFIGVAGSCGPKSCQWRSCAGRSLGGRLTLTC